MSETRAVDSESRRIIREELGANLLVEAGAGSGKTQMLAERMAAGVGAGVYVVEHMAAVTFTRKAAAELRGRFQLALEARLKAAEPGAGSPKPAGRHPEGERERLEHALRNIERLFSGTIHSFCARLLRERPVECGVSPGFTELDEEQDLVLRKRAWREFVAQARSSGDPDMLALLDAGLKPADLDHAFGVVCSNEDVEFPPGEGACPDPKPAWAALQAFWRELQKHLPADIPPDTSCGIQQAALTFRSRLRVSGKRLDRPATVAALLDAWDCQSKITQYRWASGNADKKRLKATVEPLHEYFLGATVAPYLAQWRQYVYRLSLSLLTRARDRAAAGRRRLNTLNYGDLLTLTAKVLRENAGVRLGLQRKYKHLFVDEFQDTDPIQAEIVFLLAAAGRYGEGPTPEAGSPWPDWRRVPLRRGALFVVGDPKQSIYRFRRADIEIYNVVRARFAEPEIGRVLPLTMNFRSVPALCEWANDVFQTRFPAAASAHSPAFAGLDPKDEEGHRRRGAKAVAGGVFTLTHACSEGKAVIGDDAAAIARYIVSEVSSGRRKYSDFLILTRKKKERLKPYAAALEALNVPIEVSGAGAFGESAEVEALTVLLRALADPQDAVSLVAVLRGPLFGISDPELFAWKQAGGWFSLFGGPEASVVAQGFSPANSPVAQGSSPANSPSRVASSLAALRQYHRWTRLLPAGAALDRILEHSGYLAAAATTPGGVEAGDLLHALDRVRQVFETGGSLADAADVLAADADAASNEVESLPLEPGRTDVVRLMNLHKAKGLEADVVCLADPCGGFEPRVDVHIRRDGAVPQGWFTVVRRKEGSRWAPVLGQHADWPRHEQAEKPYLSAEQDRLLYVAATRAREILVVSRWTAAKGVPAWGCLNAFLMHATELTVPASAAARPVTVPDCSAGVRRAADAMRASVHARATESSWAVTSVTAEARHVAKMVRSSDPTSADDVTTVVRGDTASHRADAGVAWGTLVHGLLEHAMRHEGVTRDDLRRLALWLTVEQPQLRPVIDDAVDTALAVSAADFWARAKAAAHLVEAPFTVADGGRRLLTGVVDLVFADGAGWRVVDYKTDVSKELVAAGKYAEQMAAYERALKACGLEPTGVSVQPVRFVQGIE